MNEKTNSHEDECDQNRGGLIASAPHISSILHSLSEEPLLQLQCTDKPIENGGCSNEVQPNIPPPCNVFEELFCPSLPSAGLASLALRTRPVPHNDVLKRGYLGKQEIKHRKYFVLRVGSHSGPSRLEWYKMEDSFTAVEKSARETGFFSTRKQGVIFLRCCLGVSLMSGPRKDCRVALYAKDQTLVFVSKDQQEQHEWYTAIKELMKEEQMDGSREGFDEEDAGYCTLPPASFYKQVWPVTVKLCGLGRSKALAGEVLLCLTAAALVLVRVGHDLHLPSVTLPLLAVRRFGHLDGSFFLELGRSAPHGPGEIWMEPKDEGNSSLAQQIHEVVREVVRALKVIPDFNWSATPSKLSSSSAQCLFALKRSRPKQREKPLGLNESSLSLKQSDHTKEMEEIQNAESASPTLIPLSTEPCGEPDADSYMEMKTDQSPVREGTAKGRGYMAMSGQDPPYSRHQDEYVAMASPQKHDLTKCASFSFLQSSFSSGSDVPSPQHITEQTPPPWTLYSGQLSNTRAVTTWATSSPVSRAGGLKPVSLFGRRPMELARPDTDAEQPVRSCLLSCLPSCLQPKTNG